MPLSKELEPVPFTCSTSPTQDVPRAAHTEVLGKNILHQSMSMQNLSLILQSDELREIAASAAPPPPPRGSGRDAAMFTRVCSGEQEAGGLPNAQVAWGTLAQRFKRAQPAPPAPNECAKLANRSLAASCSRDAFSLPSFCNGKRYSSAADSFHRGQSKSAKRQKALADLLLLAGDDDGMDDVNAAASAPSVYHQVPPLHFLDAPCFMFFELPS
jgi:hypothetical protein